MKKVISLLLLFILVSCSAPVYELPKSYTSIIIEEYNISKQSFIDSLQTREWNSSSKKTFYKQIDSLIIRAYIDSDSVQITKRIDK